MRKLLILPLLLLELAGCAALGPVNRALTQAKSPVVQAGVTLAVATAIGNGADQKTKAAAIKAIATEVYQASSAPSATIAVLEAALNTEIEKVATNPADKAAFMILASTLEGFLQTYIATNPAGAVTADTLVNIQGVAQAVVQATSFYGV